MKAANEHSILQPIHNALQQARVVLACLVLFSLNAWLCFPLFLLAYSARVESAEPTFFSISRYMMENWRDLSWWPLWYDGIPLHQTYPPLLHAMVALGAAAVHAPPAHAYHCLTAFLYCLGPVSLLLLALRMTKSLSCAMWIGLAYSLISPTAFFIPWVRAEIGSPFRPWRICTLILNGDGPHMAALAVLPLALLAIDSLVRRPRYWAFLWTVIALGGIALTNWIGSFALGVSALLYLIAHTDGSDDRRKWTIAAAAAVTAYLLVCPWIPPSTIRAIPANSAMILVDARAVASATPLRLALVLILVLGVKALCEWRRLDPVLQFALLWCIVFNGIPIAAEWCKFPVVLQSHRYTLELDLTFCFLAVLLVHRIVSHAPRSVSYVALVVAAICVLLQMHTWKEFMTALVQPIDIRQTIEFRTSQWLKNNIGQGRVFATGSISGWLNALTDVPQFGGGADQGLPAEQFRTAFRTIHGDAHTPLDPDGSLSLTWMRAYGLDMAVVGGPHSQEYYKMYRDPARFARVSRQVWREGDDAIYSIPRRSRSLAQVVPPNAIVRKAPVSGDDVEEVKRYVDALEDPALPKASFTWLNRHSVLIGGKFLPDQVISVQMSYHPGWHATVDDRIRPLREDGLGLMVVEPRCSGHCQVKLLYDGGIEGTLTRASSALTLAVLLGAAVFVHFRRN